MLQRADSDQLFFIYTGGRQLLMADPMAFLRSSGLDQRNLVMLSDRRLAFYQQGVAAPLDSWQTLLDWHRTYVRRLPHVRRVFCLGTSMGGYAALLFGYLLEVEEVWAFGPPTRLDRTKHPYVARERANLRLLLLKSNGRTKYNVFYNRAFKRDHLAALQLVGCEGVRLRPQDGAGHDVVSALMAAEALRALLPPPTAPVEQEHA